MTADHATPNYAVGLVIYHPEECLLRRINQIIEFGIKIYIFDNSPFDNIFGKFIKNRSEIYYVTAGKNVGIGYSLSILCATAYAHGYKRLLFLDQDTGISGKTLKFIETYTKALPIEIQNQYAVVVFNSDPVPSTSIKEVPLAISSGSLFNLLVLSQIGWHNEKYFVDCVDYELCLRARRCGFKIGIVSNTPDFDHVTEQPDWSISIFSKQLLIRRYSAARIKDAIGAYLRLIIKGLLRNRPGDTYILVKSLGLYIFGQLTSRLVKDIS